MRPAYPATKDLVLIGGGHAHAVMLRRWAMRPLPGARLTLINPGPAAPYTGMLPGYVAGHYTRAQLEIDLVRLARHAGARLILDEAVGLDPDLRTVALGSGRVIAFDIASINVGVTSFSPAGGFDAPVRGAKPMPAFADAWDAFIREVEAGKPPEAAVIGGGVGGCELALAMAYRLKRAANGRAVSVSVVERADRVAPKAAGALGDALERELTRAGVRVITSDGAAGSQPRALLLASGGSAPARFIAAAAGASPPRWLEQTGLALENGYVAVAPTLRSLSHEAVFAAGDAAEIAGAAREKAGVFAVRAGKALHGNLRAALAGRPLRRFRPQRDYLKLVSLGGKRAVAEKWGLAATGAWAWRWKNAIDENFMRRLNEPPKMDMRLKAPREAASGLSDLLEGAPPCAGCGAKTGEAMLRGALARLPRARGAHVETGPGDDAAVLRLPGEPVRRQVVTTDHFPAFSLDYGLVARIAAIHALGDVWAMGAEPQTALAHLILPPLSAELRRRTLDEILDAASQVLAEEGAGLIGGHTSLGAELTLGFTVLGGLDGRDPVRLSGALPGDVLILTKPLGTGVLLAGEMRGQARGRDVAAALTSMETSSGPAARVLAQTAAAMTDVTGFGLAGHLASLAEASRGCAELAVDAVPLLSGAPELAAAGVRSSLWPENAARLAQAEADADLAGDPRVDLLADPQTAGGLLAAVREDQAAAVLDALSATPTPGAIIGRILPERGSRLILRRATNQG